MLGELGDDFEFVTPKQRHFIHKYCYQPALFGWQVDQPISSAFDSKTAPFDAIEGFNWLYYKKNYSECLIKIEEFIALNAVQPKPLQVDELVETAARCCIKLENYQKALELMSTIVID